MLLPDGGIGKIMMRNNILDVSPGWFEKIPPMPPRQIFLNICTLNYLLTESLIGAYSDFGIWEKRIGNGSFSSRCWPKDQSIECE